jgi:hypothetical protein
MDGWDDYLAYCLDGDTVPHFCYREMPKLEEVVRELRASHPKPIRSRGRA